MLFNWKLKILSSVVAVAMLFTVCPSTTFAEKTWLHEILEDEKYTPSIEEVERIVKKHPEWLNEEDKDGRTPVKIAGDKGLSEIESYLFKLSASAPSGPDYAKKKAALFFDKPTWLHEILLEDEDSPPSLEEIKRIVTKHPEWINIKYGDDRTTLLEVARAKGLHEGILTLLNESDMKSQIEVLQQCNKSLQEKVDKLQKQLEALTAKVGVITGGTIDSAAITGGTVSGLTAPLAIADGGTGVNALGTASQGFIVNTAGTGLEWGVVDTLDGHITGNVASGDDLNDYTTYGVYMITNVKTITNAPAGMLYGGKLTVSNGNGGTVLQKIEGNYGNEQWARCGYKGSWYVWKRMTSPLTTQGDLYVRGAANDTRLGIGTAGQVLQVNAAGTGPEWATVGIGSYCATLLNLKANENNYFYPPELPIFSIWPFQDFHGSGTYNSSTYYWKPQKAGRYLVCLRAWFRDASTNYASKTINFRVVDENSNILGSTTNYIASGASGERITVSFVANIVDTTVGVGLFSTVTSGRYIVYVAGTCLSYIFLC